MCTLLPLTADRAFAGRWPVPELNIDTPFIEMPDQVDGRFCGWESTCTVGDRNEALTPSATRTQFSLLQLALHNLDPEDAAHLSALPARHLICNRHGSNA